MRPEQMKLGCFLSNQRYEPDGNKPGFISGNDPHPTPAAEPREPRDPATEDTYCLYSGKACDSVLRGIPSLTI